MKILSALLLSTFAASATFAETPEEILAQSQATHAALQTLNAQDLSCASAADCDALAIGNMACGGPAGYIVASKRNAHYQSATLQGLAATTSHLDRDYNELAGIVSICIVIPEPAVACVANACVAQ